MDIEAPIEASGQVSVEPFVASLNESFTEPKKKGLKKSKGSYCAAVNSHNSVGNCKLSVFQFPKDAARCTKWVQNSRCDDLKKIPVQKLYNYELCSNYFEDSQFTNKDKKKRLILGDLQHVRFKYLLTNQLN